VSSKRLLILSLANILRHQNQRFNVGPNGIVVDSSETVVHWTVASYCLQCVQLCLVVQSDL